MNGARPLLAQAVALVNQGDLDAAEEILKQAHSLNENDPAALYLSGVIANRRENWSAAEAFLRRAISIDAAQPMPRVALARALRGLGRASEGAQLTRSVIERVPQYWDAWVELGKAQEETGALDEAEASYRQVLTNAPNGAEAGLALASLMNQRGQRAQAEALLKILQDAPSLTDAERASVHQALAQMLSRQRRHVEALNILDKAGDARAIEADRASLFQHLGRFDEAIAAYQRILSANPLDMDAHSQLNETLYRLKRDDEFLSSFDAASARAPHIAELPLTKGRWLLKAGRPQEAYEAFAAALSIAPQDAGALAGLGRALEELGDGQKALEAHAKNAKAHPDSPDVLNDYSSILLRQGEARSAREAAERALALRPGDQSALSLITLCHRALDDEREFELNNYDGFIQVMDLEPPEGYFSMESFSADLAAYLNSLHGDAREYFTQTLRGGTRLYGDVFDNGHKLVDLLRVRIDDAVRRYALSLTGRADHPFIARRNRGFAYSGSWSSRLSDCGHHVNHVHPKGWISSAYYVAVPDATEDADKREGWIKFGEPSEDFGAAFTPRRFIKPVPGRLVLFPSYMWHGTVPFHSRDTRMTIAFDAVPR